MPNDFFEISIDRLPVSHDLKYKKYTPEKYQKMGHSLQEVQNLMDQGATGKEILANSDPSDLYGTGETYRHFYNPESGDRVKLDFDSQGNVDYTNGRHRVEEARKQGISHIPAEVGVPTSESLENIKNNFGSGRDLSQFNPRQEQAELDRETYFNKPTNELNTSQNNQDFKPNYTNTEPSTAMSNEQPQSPFKNAEALSQDDLIPAKEPNFDNPRGQTIEQGRGENGSAPGVTTKTPPKNVETDRPSEKDIHFDKAMDAVEKMEALNPDDPRRHNARKALEEKHGITKSETNPQKDQNTSETEIPQEFPKGTPSNTTNSAEDKKNLRGDYGQNKPSPPTESSEQAGTKLGDHQRLENLKQEKLDNTGTEAQSQNDSQSDRDRLSDLYSQKPSDTPNFQEQTDTNNNSQF